MLTYEQSLALADIYKQARDKRILYARLRPLLEKKYSKNTIAALFQKGSIEKETLFIKLSPEGLDQAKFAYRAINILRSFCLEVLSISREEAEKYIEKLFVSLDDYLLDKFCHLIGHSFTDSPGKCCTHELEKISETVFPLKDLPISTPAKVVFIKTSSANIMKELLSFGFHPGEKIVIKQLSPVYLLEIGDNEIAADEKTGNFIYVRKI